MRRIVMFNRVTANGYFAGPDGSLDWVVPDEEVDWTAAEGIPGTDTFLLGRRTYELFKAFWPHALDDSATSIAERTAETETRGSTTRGGPWCPDRLIRRNHVR